MVRISHLQQITRRKTLISMSEYSKPINSCSLLSERSESKQRGVKITRSTKSQAFLQTQEQQSNLLSTPGTYEFKTFAAPSSAIRTQILCVLFVSTILQTSKREI